MKKLLFLSLILSFSITTYGQVSHGGEPIRWQSADLDFTYERLPQLDMSVIEAEDAVNDQYKEFGYRFGIERTTSYNTDSDGSWTEESGRNVWRFGVHAPSAKGVSFVFTEFNIPKSAKLFIYDKEQTHFIGSFNYRNTQANGMLATSLVYGEDVIVELSIPQNVERSDVNLTIGQVVHAYRGITSKFEEIKYGRGPFGNSGSCNINVNCPEGDDWQVEKQSVALIVNGGSASCSGALINNTNNDGYPYFLTANHCLGFGVGNWVFYFNHESSSCNGNTGPTNQSVSGATLLASNGGSDFALLEINNGNPIPANFDAEWAGWDRTDNENAVSSATGIHHPSGDVKKICHEEDAPYHANQSGAAVWYINQWEEGMTEGGSSGSPLFNQDHRIIGQLYGGSASCQNITGADWYGRMGVSWDGNSSSTRLRDWLDPSNTGATVLDGYPTGAVVYNLDAASSGLSGIPSDLCEVQPIEPVFELRNNGTNNLTSATISYSYNGGGNQTINWTGNLAQGSTDGITLASFTPQYGVNTISVTVSSPNGQTDENSNNNTLNETFEIAVGEEILKVRIETDNFGYEVYWEVRGPNNQVIGSGGNTNVGPNGGGDRIADANDPGAYANNVVINETVQLVGDGCYTFLIVDDYGDGICCGFQTGSGEYRLRDGNNQLLAEGGEFDDEEFVEIAMVQGLSVSEVDFGQLNVYPNPTAETVFVDVEKYEELNLINISDMMGRTVLERVPANARRSSIDLSNISSGVYYVNLIGETGRVTKKLIVQKD